MTQPPPAELSLAQLAIFVGLVPDAALVVDAAGLILHANQEAGELLGFAVRELEGRTVEEFVPENVRPDHIALRASFAKNPAQRSMGTNADITAVTRSGATLPVDISLSPVQTTSGHVTIVMIYDLTERLRREARDREAIESREARYRDLLEAANDIIYTHDLDGNFTSINRAGEAILGYTPHESVKLNLTDILSGDDLGLARAIIPAKAQGSTPATNYELGVLAKDGRRVPLEVSTRLLYEGDAPVAVMGIARDVSERKLFERHVAQSQKTEAIGRLAAGIAHDFNNILTVILGIAGMVKGEMDEESPFWEDLLECESAGERAAELTRQLLAFSRQQVLAPQALDIGDVVSNIEYLLKRMTGEDVEFATRIEDGLWPVMADRGQLEQVLANLVVNAKDAMPTGGSLAIVVSNEMLGPGALTVGSEPGDFVCIEVVDTGDGIDEAHLPQLFEPFYTTKAAGTGTGLGLSTVEGIVAQSGGHISVSSTRGEGTTFRIRLPRTHEE